MVKTNPLVLLQSHLKSGNNLFEFALCLKVQVHIEDDPERIFKTTEASQARVASIYEEELELQHPLFDIHGYDEKKITSDRRLRVEKALRDAGMHNSDYARRIMASIQPPQQPRKDQHSTLFKSD
ncbi:coiled-coil domain-containing protein 148-like [Acropora palmata]|uniref:coiled-coil domain-containing protein 148-like n=1 Tax=Acropora palmata TaxID=6131 RepID=UPI003DA0E066